MMDSYNIQSDSDNQENNINSLLFNYINNMIYDEINNPEDIHTNLSNYEFNNSQLNNTNDMNIYNMDNTENAMNNISSLFNNLNSVGLIIDTSSSNNITTQNNSSINQSSEQAREQEPENINNINNINNIIRIYYSNYAININNLSNDTIQNNNTININNLSNDTIQNNNTININNLSNDTIQNNNTINNLFSTMLLFLNNSTQISINQEDYEEQEDHEIHMNENLFSSKIKKKINNNFKHDDECCPICYENFLEYDECGITICNHVFHYKCIKEWLTNKCRIPICPVCRKDMRE